MKECLTAYRTSSGTLRVPPSPEGKAGNKALPFGEGARRAGEVNPEGNYMFGEVQPEGWMYFIIVVGELYGKNYS